MVALFDGGAAVGAAMLGELVLGGAASVGSKILSPRDRIEALFDSIGGSWWLTVENVKIVWQAGENVVPINEADEELHVVVCAVARKTSLIDDNRVQSSYTFSARPKFVGHHFLQTPVLVFEVLPSGPAQRSLRS